MLENRVPAPRAARRARAVSRACLRIRAPRYRARAARHATTCGGIMNDAALVCIREMSARACASGAPRRHAMLHIIHCPARASSA